MPTILNGVIYNEFTPPKLAQHVKADVTDAVAWTTGNSPITIFTATGDVIVRCFAKVSTALTSTGANGTLELGLVGDTASLLVQDVVDGTAFDAGDTWSFLDEADDPAVRLPAQWIFLASGTNIVLTVGTNSMLTGAMTIYCQYVAVSVDGAIVST